MMNRLMVGLATATLAAAAAVGLGTPNAGAAAAGTWSIDAPSTSVTGTADVYAAQIQQPINADGSSVWPAKKGVVPVQFKVTKATQTTTTTTYQFESLAGASDHTAWSWIGFVPSDPLTVGGLTDVTADFTWLNGSNHSGGLRWQIGTPDGNIMIDYGDVSTSLQSGTAGSGANMVDSPTAAEDRCESTQVGGTMYTPWSYVASNFGGLTVDYVALIVDGGWSEAQVLDVTSLTVNGNTYTDPLTPAPVVSASTTPVQTNTDPATLHLVRTAGGAIGDVDETLVTSAQGDTGGNFRQVDGKYIYNLDVRTVGAGTYQAFIHIAGADLQAPGVFGLR